MNPLSRIQTSPPNGFLLRHGLLATVPLAPTLRSV
jgi:hypothetical protein